MPTLQPRPFFSAPPTADGAEAFLLIVVDGPSAGAEVAVPAERPLTVGRMTGNGLVVRDDSLSRRHFQLLYEEGELRIEDLGSSYGTFLNEERLSPGVPRSIRPEDAVRAGQSRFALHAAAAAPAARPAPRSAPAAPGGPPTSAPSPGRQPGSASGAESDSDAAASTQPSPDGANDDVDVPTGPDGYRDESVSEISARAGLEAGFARPGDGPAAVLEQLAELDPEEGLKFLAAALPPRTAVRWAADCVKSVANPTGDAGPRDEAALAAALAWADDPTEENRRACEAAAEALKHQTAAAWCATAAFFSHGSLGPPHTAVVLAPPNLSAVAVNAAVTLAAVADPAAAADRRRAFLERRGGVLAGDSSPAPRSSGSAASSPPKAPPAKSPAAAGGGANPPKPPRRPGAAAQPAGAPTPPRPPAPPKPPS
ncbi:FHA domain-containing protein [Alienimonas californiensis]|uniref:Oxoglutarate dehydrogenase inhibitor n=1 Tax=Alienimonas californiensis TaxID=2527989 RepID=A0A517P4G4_9PLAN|nr:FHA domain-containing protein [Alienimonas californiensis]QDT14251.1 Oxoglutarate dehydrogenase inhibitor [Alienimonas californiensis]